jgi:hypothetical protein
MWGVGWENSSNVTWKMPGWGIRRWKLAEMWMIRCVDVDEKMTMRQTENRIQSKEDDGGDFSLVNMVVTWMRRWRENERKGGGKLFGKMVESFICSIDWGEGIQE